MVLNPSSGRLTSQRVAERVIEALLSDGTLTHVDTIRTEKVRDAYQASRNFLDWQYDLILAVGGDGTINEVVSGLLDGQHQTPLAVIPAGTMNDFAFARNLPRTEDKICDMIRSRKLEAIDIGCANNRYFVNVAAAGFLTDVAHKVPVESKTVLGQLAYILEGARDLSTQAIQPITMHFETDDRQFDEDVLLFLVTNSSSVGGFRNLAPEASVSDGLLDVMIVKRQNVLELLPLLVQLVNGDHVNNPTITYFQTSRLKVTCAEPQEIPLDLDGELGGQLPLDIKVLPSALRLLVP
jgi:diacylglycerol kinase (ATP)